MRLALPWLSVLAYMALIWLLSASTQPVDLSVLPFQDKGAHFVQYAVLGGLLARAVRRTWPSLRGVRCLLVASVPAIAWGYFDELHQAFVPGRVSSTADLLADALGALAGAGAFLAFEALATRLRERARG